MKSIVPSFFPYVFVEFYQLPRRQEAQWAHSIIYSDNNDIFPKFDTVTYQVGSIEVFATRKLNSVATTSERPSMYENQNGYFTSSRDETSLWYSETEVQTVKFIHFGNIKDRQIVCERTFPVWVIWLMRMRAWFRRFHEGLVSNSVLQSNERRIG
jgi:hypothetical protein